MLGVEILSQETIQLYSVSGWVWVCLGIFVVVVVCSCIWLPEASQLIIVFATLIFLMTVIFGLYDVKTGEYTEYKATVSDDVSMNDFNEKYEIVSQEGKIYTIKERVKE